MQIPSRTLFALLRPFALAVALALSSQTATAQNTPAWQLAAEGGSQRLFRAALFLERPGGFEAPLSAIDRRMGIVPQGQTARYAFPPVFSITPDIGYDQNFNGGLGADTLSFAGLVWTVTPETRAQPSFYVGARAGVEQRFVIGPGSALTFRGNATYRRSLERSQEFRALSLGVCSENQLTPLTGLDLCVNRSVTKRTRSTAYLTTASVAMSRIFQSQNALTEATLVFGREIRPNVGRNTAQLSLVHLNRSAGVFDASIFVGERKVPLGLTTLSANVGHGRFIAGKYYHLRLNHVQETGAQIAGMRNHKHEYGLYLTLPRVARVRPTLGLVRQKHDLPEFDRKFVSLSFDFSGFRSQ
ncbi:MAG: hypothetical protein ACK4HW_05260 [Roseinatronobacter sp.]